MRIIDEINQVMPPGAVLDVSLETVQNLASMLVKAKAYIEHTDTMYQNAMGFVNAVERQRESQPQLTVPYQELKDAIREATFPDRIYRENKPTDEQIAHYHKLLDIQARYLERMTVMRHEF